MFRHEEKTGENARGKEREHAICYISFFFLSQPVRNFDGDDSASYFAGTYHKTEQDKSLKNKTLKILCLEPF